MRTKADVRQRPMDLGIHTQSSERHFLSLSVFNQYSSASMIVMTGSVTEGSDGSGEWYVRLLS
jgi:hypothetical protein